jgi:hypothetical protein
MNPTRCIIAALLVPLVCSGGERVRYVRGKCQGGNRPSISCKTCERCAYCGTKPGSVVKTKRPENSGTCIVCERRKQR